MLARLVYVDHDLKLLMSTLYSCVQANVQLWILWTKFTYSCVQAWLVLVRANYIICRHESFQLQL